MSSGETEAQDWTGEQSERGAKWLYDLCYFLYKIFGWWVISWLVYPFVTFFFFTDRDRYRASRQYFDRLTSSEVGREALGHEPDWKDCYRQFLEFGGAVFDRVSLWLGYEGRYDVTFPDREQFLDYVNRDQGAILLSFHVGAFDIMRFFALEKGVVVNVVAYWDNAPLVNQLLENIDSSSQVNLIKINPSEPQGMLELKECVDRGEFVAVLGDRVSPGAHGRRTRVEFMGKPAYFPQGPYLMAHFLECPVLLTYCVRVDDRRYQVNMETFSDEIKLSRDSRDREIKQYAQDYALKMEHVCRMYPYQWYNFYDFWSQSDDEQH